MKYFVSYNAKFMAEYKSVKACLNFINRKGWKNDENNMLYIVDEDGEEYDSVTGETIQEEVDVKELSSKELIFL